MTAGEPEVAVIVGAYGREPFLARAVRSVLSQTVDRSRFELLVTKNFPNAEIDQELERSGVPARLDDDPRIGPWLLRAVRATRAPLVAFLDDDDAFEPGRLAAVLEAFREHPELDFYRNRVRVIGADDLAVPPERWRAHERDALFDRTGPVLLSGEAKREAVRFAARGGSASFNSSTMVVRRSLFDGEFGSAFARTQLPDLALFVLGALSSGAMYFDDRRWTQFRYYAGNVTHRVPWLRHAEVAHRDLASLARSHGRREVADWLAGTADHFDRLYRSGSLVEGVLRGADRRSGLKDAADYLRFLGRHPAERRWNLDVWSAPIYAAVNAVAPSLARAVAERRPTRRDA